MLSLSTAATAAPPDIQYDTQCQSPPQYLGKEGGKKVSRGGEKEGKRRGKDQGWKRRIPHMVTHVTLRKNTYIHMFYPPRHPK